VLTIGKYLEQEGNYNHQPVCWCMYNNESRQNWVRFYLVVLISRKAYHLLR